MPIVGYLDECEFKYTDERDATLQFCSSGTSIHHQLQEKENLSMVNNPLKTERTTGTMTLDVRNPHSLNLVFSMQDAFKQTYITATLIAIGVSVNYKE